MPAIGRVLDLALCWGGPRKFGRFSIVLDLYGSILSPYVKRSLALDKLVVFFSNRWKLRALPHEKIAQVQTQT